MTFADLATKAAAAANNPSFFAPAPTTSAARPYSATRSVEAPKSA